MTEECRRDDGIVHWMKEAISWIVNSWIMHISHPALVSSELQADEGVHLMSDLPSQIAT